MFSKFVETFDVSEWEVETDDGWVDVVKSHKTVPYEVWRLRTENGMELEAADRHLVFKEGFFQTYVRYLSRGDVIHTVNGVEKVVSNVPAGGEEEMYDLELSKDSNHRYYTNGILSHNTTSCTIFALWMTNFFRDKKILFAANKFATILEIMARVRLAYELTPNWLKPGIKEWTKGKIVFSNDSQIEGVTTTSDSARSRSANVLMIDEAAYIDNDRDFMASVMPIVSSAPGTKIIMTSTPNGRSNVFYETYEAARLGVSKDGWTPFRMDWFDFPGRDEKWQKKMFATLNGDTIRWNREFGNSFEGSSYTLLRAEDITRFKEKVTSDKWRSPLQVDIGLWKYNQWEAPKRGATYLIGADSADGTGRNNSVALIFDVSNGANIRQVASFSSNTITPTEFAYVLAKLAAMHGKAYISMEANSVGSDVLRLILNTYEHENIVNYSAGAGRSLGIVSGNTVKSSACRWLREITAMLDITLNDKFLVSELEYFERKESAMEVYSAKAGMGDDYVMAFVWAMFCLNERMVENIFIVERYMEAKNGFNLPLIIRNSDSDYYRDSSYDGNGNSSLEKRLSKMDRAYKSLIGAGSEEILERNKDQYEQYKNDLSGMMDQMRNYDEDSSW